MSMSPSTNSRKCSLAPGSPRDINDRLKTSFVPSLTKRNSKNSNFQTYVAHHQKIFLQMQNLESDRYAGIDIGTCLRFFLFGIDKLTLKTAVQICESQAFESTDFQACASYLTSIVQKTLLPKRVHVAITSNKVDCIQVKNRDGTDWYLPPAKYKVPRKCLQVTFCQTERVAMTRLQKVQG